MKLPIQNLTDFSNGLITKGAVSYSQMPSNVVSESTNWNFDRIGCARTRLGTTLLGNKLTGDILGLYEFRDNDDTYNRIIAVNGTVAYYLSSGTWTSKRTGLTSGSKAEFTTFLDYVWMVNGTEATAIWDGASGTSFITTGQALNAPTGSYIENFRSRVWIANSSDRLYYSSLPDTNLDITWTATDWIDISPQDGNQITGLKRDKNSLLVFKNNYIYRVYSAQDTEPDPKIHIGTYSGRSIVGAKNGIYFHHPTGIYRYADGGVEEVSKPISDFIEAVPASQYTKVCGWTDGDHILHSLGDLTVNGVSYTNVVSRYTISSRVWTIYSYPTKFLATSDYDDNTTIFNLCGDNDGNILKLDSGTTDNGNEIFYSLITRWNTFDNLFSTRKNITNMSAIHKGGEGSLIAYQCDNESENKWRPLFSIKDKNPVQQSVDIRGQKIRFRIQGTSIGEQIEFCGIEILSVDSELVK